jgi:hypothetical protein
VRILATVEFEGVDRHAAPYQGRAPLSADIARSADPLRSPAQRARRETTMAAIESKKDVVALKLTRVEAAALLP